MARSLARTDAKLSQIRSFAASGGDERFQRHHQLLESRQIDLLRSVAPGFGRVGMDLDEQGICADGHGAFAHRDDEIGAARALTGVDDDRAVRFLFDDGDGGKVERVGRVGFERSNAAFAKEQVGVVVGQDVFPWQQPFFDLHGQAAFEQDRLSGSSGGNQKLKVLGVARADLNDVRVFGHKFGMRFGEQFGNDGEAGFAARFGQELQSLGTQPLKFAGGGSWLERSATQDGGPGFLHGFGCGQELRFALDGTRPGHDVKFAAPDHGAVGQVDGGIGLVGLAANQFMAFLDRHHLLHLRPDGKCFEGMMRPFVADGTDNRPFDPAHDMEPSLRISLRTAASSFFVMLGLRTTIICSFGASRRVSTKKPQATTCGFGLRVRVNAARSAGET